MLIKIINEFISEKESKFSKDIGAEKTFSKVPTNTPRVFHVETTWARRFQVVFSSFQHGTQAVYL